MAKKISKQLSPEAHYFKYFLIGAVVFVLSLGTVVYTNLLVPPSLLQETTALVGLIFSIPSALLASYCYLRILLARLITFKNR